MRTIEMSDKDYDALMKWIGRRGSGSKPGSLSAQNQERRAIIVLKKIYKKYVTEPSITQR